MIYTQWFCSVNVQTVRVPVEATAGSSALKGKEAESDWGSDGVVPPSPLCGFGTLR